MIASDTYGLGVQDLPLSFVDATLLKRAIRTMQWESSSYIDPRACRVVSYAKIRDSRHTDLVYVPDLDRYLSIEYPSAYLGTGEWLIGVTTTGQTITLAN